MLHTEPELEQALLGPRWVIKALAGEVPDHIYNPEVLPKWRERFEGDDLLP